MDNALGVTCKKSLPNIKSQRFSISPSSVTVFGFIYRYVIHFNLVFVSGMRYRSYLFVVTWVFNCLSTINYKDYPFSTEFPLYLCWKSVDHICVSLFLDSVSFPLHSIDLYIYSFSSTTLVWLLYLIVSLKSGTVSSPTLFFFSNMSLLL